MHVEGWTLNVPIDDPSASSATEQTDYQPQMDGDLLYAGESKQEGGLSLPIKLLDFRLESDLVRSGTTRRHRCV